MWPNLQMENFIFCAVQTAFVTYLFSASYTKKASYLTQLPHISHNHLKISIKLSLHTLKYLFQYRYRFAKSTKKLSKLKLIFHNSCKKGKGNWVIQKNMNNLILLEFKVRLGELLLAIWNTRSWYIMQFCIKSLSYIEQLVFFFYHCF